MCRLLGYATLEPRTLQQVIGNSFSEFVELSSIHHDGWGIADETGVIAKEIIAARESDVLRALATKTQFEGSLLHLRWASPGIPVDVSNNHPFTYGEFSFIHNGSLHPSDALDILLEENYKAEITSASDSHRYFLLLMQNIDKFGIEAGIKRTLVDIKNVATYASLNAMLLSKDFLIVINEHDINNRPSIVDEFYYDIRFKESDTSIVIASSGWNQADWEFLPNHTIMVINRKDLSRAFTSLYM